MLLPSSLVRRSREWHPCRSNCARGPLHIWIILPSLLVTSLRMEADWSPTARFNERRHPENSIGLVCALGEQRRPTASTSYLPACALGEHRSDAGVVPPILVCALGEQRRRTASTSTLFREHRDCPGHTPPCLCANSARRSLCGPLRRSVSETRRHPSHTPSCLNLLPPRRNVLDASCRMSPNR
jgi:hypothetical protein